MDRAKDKNKLKHISIASAIIVCSTISTGVYKSSASPNKPRFSVGFPKFKLRLTNPFKKSSSSGNLTNPYGPNSPSIPLVSNEPNLSPTHKPSKLRRLWDRIRGKRHHSPNNTPNIIPPTLDGNYIPTDTPGDLTLAFMTSMNTSWKGLYDDGINTGSNGNSPLVSHKIQTPSRSRTGSGSSGESQNTTSISRNTNPDNNPVTMTIRHDIWGNTPDDDDEWETDSNSSVTSARSTFDPTRPAITRNGQLVEGPGLEDPYSLPHDAVSQTQLEEHIYDQVYNGTRPTPPPVAPKPILTQAQKEALGIGGERNPIYDQVPNEPPSSKPPVPPKPTKEQIESALGQRNKPIDYNVLGARPKTKTSTNNSNSSQ